MAENTGNSNDLLSLDIENLTVAAAEGAPENEKGPNDGVHAKGEAAASKQGPDVPWAEVFNSLRQLPPSVFNQLKHSLLASGEPKLVNFVGSFASPAASTSYQLSPEDPTPGSSPGSYYGPDSDGSISEKAGQGHGSNDAPQYHATGLFTSAPPLGPKQRPLPSEALRPRQDAPSPDSSPYRGPSGPVPITDSTGNQRTAAMDPVSVDKLTKLGFNPHLYGFDDDTCSSIVALPSPELLDAINMLKSTLRPGNATGPSPEDPPAKGTPSPSNPTQWPRLPLLPRDPGQSQTFQGSLDNRGGASYLCKTGNQDNEAARYSIHGGHPIPTIPGHVDSVYTQTDNHAPIAPGGTSNSAFDNTMRPRLPLQPKEERAGCPFPGQPNTYGGYNAGRYNNYNPHREGTQPGLAGAPQYKPAATGWPPLGTTMPYEIEKNHADANGNARKTAEELRAVVANLGSMIRRNQDELYVARIRLQGILSRIQ